MMPNLFRCLAALLLVATGVGFTPAKPIDDDFNLVVTLVTGERGKDSNSTTTTLTLSGDKLVYHQGYHGAHSSGRAPFKKEYSLTTSDRDELIRSLREKSLLVTKTLTTLSPVKGPGSYFTLVIRSKLSGKEHSVTIDLPRDAPKVKADRLYRDSVSLVQQLYRVINRTDPDISMPGLIP
jgi:hypothetical protein